MGQNKAQKQAAERAKAAAPNAAQPAAVVEQPKPAAPAAVAPTAPAPAATVSKQQLTIMKLTVALREQRQIEVKPEMLTQDGKYINLLIGKEWPVIQIGASGGIVLPVIKSYPNAFNAALEGDKLLAKQTARDQKKSAAPAPAPAAAQVIPPAAKESPAAKKAKGHEQIERQLETATA
jgi:hypothetical protein